MYGELKSCTGKKFVATTEYDFVGAAEKFLLNFVGFIRVTSLNFVFTTVIKLFVDATKCYIIGICVWK